MAIQLQPEERDLARFNQAIRELVEGRMNAVNQVTLTPGAALTTVDWPNCSKDSIVILFPRTANAAAAVPTTYIGLTDIVQGGFTIRHANNAQVDKTFSFLCVGG